jgi:hypothetical protein
MQMVKYNLGFLLIPKHGKNFNLIASTPIILLMEELIIVWYVEVTMVETLGIYITMKKVVNLVTTVRNL